MIKVRNSTTPREFPLFESWEHMSIAELRAKQSMCCTVSVSFLPVLSMSKTESLAEVLLALRVLPSSCSTPHLCGCINSSYPEQTGHFCFLMLSRYNFNGMSISSSNHSCLCSALII